MSLVEAMVEGVRKPEAPGKKGKKGETLSEVLTKAVSVLLSKTTTQKPRGGEAKLEETR